MMSEFRNEMMREKNNGISTRNHKNDDDDDVMDVVTMMRNNFWLGTRLSCENH